MKFNEKLIELRKKQGLSQEELGYKLNVTRQTVSKWELGQTTPEMDKLSELSNIFGISVDSLLNETEDVKIEDQKIESNNNSGSKIVLIILGVVIGVIALALLMYSIIFKGLLNFGDKSIEKGTQLMENLMSKGLDIKEKMDEEYENEVQESREKFQQDREEEHNQKMNEFNQTVQQYQNEYNQTVQQMNEEYDKSTQQMMEDANQWQQQMMQQQQENAQQFLQQMTQQ